MTWKSAVNSAFERGTGLRLVRAGETPQQAPQQAPRAERQPTARNAAEQQPAVTKRSRRVSIARRTTSEVRAPAHPETDRLLERPVFVFSSVRSGSTLLRLVLNAHSMLHAPHELHVRRLRVVPTTPLSRKAMAMLGHDEADLEHLLWDRVLHRELVLSGKRFVVDKTPSNSFVHERIATAWPDARFIFLLRHPGSVAASWAEASEGRRTPEAAARDALRYLRATEQARQALSGLTIRYEDLTGDPERTTREICDFLDIPWESAMLSYGGEAQFVRGVGDWSDKVRSGSVQPARALPSDVPEPLLPLARAWGYVSG